jgi:hypothetical protein
MMPLPPARAAFFLELSVALEHRARDHDVAARAVNSGSRSGPSTKAVQVARRTEVGASLGRNAATLMSTSPPLDLADDQAFDRNAIVVAISMSRQTFNLLALPATGYRTGLALAGPPK